MRALGILLIVFGAAVLLFGGIGYTKSRHTTDTGPVQVSTDKKELITPVAGAVAAILGVVLVVAGRRESE